MPTQPTCRACQSTDLRPYTATERRFGTNESFHYGECTQCGALSIETVPADLDRHYPNYYASFTSSHDTTRRPELNLSLIRQWLTGFHGIEKCLDGMLNQARLGLDARILDVGCGHGIWLNTLREKGFTNLQGVDPYLSDKIETAPGIPIRQASIHEVDGLFDFITYHHVLEHVPNPRQEFAAAVSHLKPGGHLLVRVPVADSWARCHYKNCWVQWDAPRHLWVPTRAALRRLAGENHLREISMIDDSVPMQIWGSRRYRHGLSGFVGKYSLLGPRRYFLPALPGLVAAMAWTHWLNFRNQGDQVSVLWQRPVE